MLTLHVPGRRWQLQSHLRCVDVPEKEAKTAMFKFRALLSKICVEECQTVIFGNDILLSLLSAISLASLSTKTVIAYSPPRADDWLQKRRTLLTPTIQNYLREKYSLGNEEILPQLAKKLSGFINCDNEYSVAWLRSESFVTKKNCTFLEDEIEVFESLHFDHDSEDLDYQELRVLKEFLPELKFEDVNEAFILSRQVLLTSECHQIPAAALHVPCVNLGSRVLPLTSTSNYTVEERLLEILGAELSRELFENSAERQKYSECFLKYDIALPTTMNF